ncbi:hypothetical protein J6590_010708 [Homalodisca vitripennis]|nr:hypothetical protein J6590_010708 [Homalodisca vitripennis]
MNIINRYTSSTLNMPKKRKSDLSQSSRQSLSKKKARSQETSDETERRRNEQVIRQEAVRHARTPEQASYLRLQHAHYMASRRATQARREEQAQRQASLRAAETPHQAEYRRQQHSMYIADQRGSETPEQFSYSIKSELVEVKQEDLSMEDEESSNKSLLLQPAEGNQGNLEESLEIISQCIQVVPIWRCPIIVMGDINIDCLNVNRDNMLLEDIMRSCEDETITVEVLDEGISDHTAQLCTLHHQQVKPTAQMTEKRQFSERNMRDIKIKLQQESWEDLITAIDADTAYNLFSNTLGMIINSACPLKKSRVKGKRRNKITDAEAERLRKVFLQAQIVYNTTGQFIHKQDTASKKKAYDLRLKELRRKEVTDKILHAENKSKAFWQ